MNANTTINARNIDISADAKARLESAVEYIREQYPDVDIKAIVEAENAPGVTEGCIKRWVETIYGKEE